MINKYNVIEKTKEDAENKILEQTETTLENLYVKVNKIETGSLIKKTKYEMEAIKKEDVKNYIKDYFNHLSYFSNIQIKSEIRESEDLYSILLMSNNNPILIGKEGRNLNSIQLLLRNSLQAQTGFNIKVNVDASNYKSKKLKYLERDIKKIIDDVLKTKEDVKLDPMNSYERRFIHNLVSNHENLKSESEGTGKERRVTIKYID